MKRKKLREIDYKTAAASTVNENNKIYVVEDDIIILMGKGGQVSREALKFHRTY